MDQDNANDDGFSGHLPDGWRHSDSETDEFGLKIAAYARQHGMGLGEDEEFMREKDDTSPLSDFEVRLRALTKPRDRGKSQQKENRRPLQERLERQPPPREPFFRAKDRQAEREKAERTKADRSDAVRPVQHVRAVSEGGPSDLNVPQSWGSRNRHRAVWLHRNTTEGEGLGLVESVKRMDEDTVLMRQTSFTGDDILALSREHSPSGARRLRQRQFSSPSSLRHMNTTIQSAAPDVEDLDFNDASVLVSTPAVNRRNRKIDELMKEDDLVDTEKQSLTTRRSRFGLGARRDDRPVSAPGEEKPFTRRRRSFKDKAEDVEPKKEQPRALSTVPSEDDDRFSQGRNESIELLRKLARASSLTPSPAPTKVIRKHPDQRRKSDTKTKEDKWDASDVPTVRQREREVRRPVSGLFSEMTATPVERPDENQKPRGPFSKLAERDPRRINSEPLQPKSALEAIVQEARSKYDPNIGDSTMASLEDIVNPNIDNSTFATDAGEKVAAQNNADAGTVRGPSEEQRQREEHEFELANRRLRVARTSIKDADRGLRRLENQLESTEKEPAKNTPDTKAETRPSISDIRRSFYSDFPAGLTPYTDHNGRTKCRHCGGSYTSVWRGLFVEFRELFYTWDSEKEGFPLKLTWLGMMIAAWWTWIFSEMLMAQLIEVSPQDASFPFVTVGVIYQIFSRPLESAKWVAGVLGNLVFGNSSTVTGPVASTVSSSSTWLRKAVPTPIRERAAARGNDGDWVAAAAAATAANARRVMKSAMDAVDEAGSMWDDGYLDL